MNSVPYFYKHTHTHTQVYLVSNLLPFHLQHLLLLIGVIYDVLSTNQQLALHRLSKTKEDIDVYNEESVLCP